MTAAGQDREQLAACALQMPQTGAVPASWLGSKACRHLPKSWEMQDRFLGLVAKSECLLF